MFIMMSAEQLDAGLQGVGLTGDEKRACDKMTPCVSRARSRTLVLDL